ncbi:hypothetical protein D3C72_1570570 [compost metagenome]
MLANTNSPSRKERERNSAAKSPLRRQGITTSRKARRLLAPSRWAASIRSFSGTPCRLLASARYIKGSTTVNQVPIRIHGVPIMGRTPSA